MSLLIQFELYRQSNHRFTGTVFKKKGISLQIKMIREDERVAITHRLPTNASLTS